MNSNCAFTQIKWNCKRTNWALPQRLMNLVPFSYSLELIESYKTCKITCSNIHTTKSECTEMESSEGLTESTSTVQRWKPSSLADQLGQRLPWETRGFLGFHRPALIQAENDPTGHQIPSPTTSVQQSPVNYFPYTCTRQSELCNIYTLLVSLH